MYPQYNLLFKFFLPVDEPAELVSPIVWITVAASAAVLAAVAIVLTIVVFVHKKPKIQFEKSMMKSKSIWTMKMTN